MLQDLTTIYLAYQPFILIMAAVLVTAMIYETFFLED